MSRIRTLRLMLGLCAAAWAMFAVGIVSLITLHLLAPPQPNVVRHVYTYEPVYTRTWSRAVATPYGVRYCCPPPPCCPRDAVSYVQYRPGAYPPVRPAPYAPDPPLPIWPFTVAGLLGAAALAASLVSTRRVAPIEP